MNVSEDMITVQGEKVLTDYLLYSNNRMLEDLNLAGN